MMSSSKSALKPVPTQPAGPKACWGGCRTAGEPFLYDVIFAGPAKSQAANLIDPRSRDLLNTQTVEENGGARRSRTDDILLAKQALYQLSYGPSPFGEQPGPIGNLSFSRRLVKVVGPIRFELMTSRLSSVRSNQLSYGPIGRTDQTKPQA